MKPFNGIDRRENKTQRCVANSSERKPATKRISRTILERLLVPTCNLNRNFVYVNGGPLMHTL